MHLNFLYLDTNQNIFPLIILPASKVILKNKPEGVSVTQ